MREKAGMERISISVPDMHCASCVMRLEGLEDTLPGIISIQASYRRQSMDVEYDPACVTSVKIIEAVQLLGYHPEL